MGCNMFLLNTSNILPHYTTAHRGRPICFVTSLTFRFSAKLSHATIGGGGGVKVQRLDPRFISQFCVNTYLLLFLKMCGFFYRSKIVGRYGAGLHNDVVVGNEKSRVKLTSEMGPRQFKGENTTEIRFLNLAVAEFVRQQLFQNV